MEYFIHQQLKSYGDGTTTFKSKEEGKDQESIQSNTHLTQDTVWESDKTQENITYKRAKSSFPAGDHKAAR